MSRRRSRRRAILTGASTALHGCRVLPTWQRPRGTLRTRAAATAASRGIVNGRESSRMGCWSSGRVRLLRCPRRRDRPRRRRLATPGLERPVRRPVRRGWCPVRRPHSVVHSATRPGGRGGRGVAPRGGRGRGTTLGAAASRKHPVEEAFGVNQGEAVFGGAAAWPAAAGVLHLWKRLSLPQPVRHLQVHSPLGAVPSASRISASTRSAGTLIAPDDLPCMHVLTTAPRLAPQARLRALQMGTR